jgi:ABC-type transport system involved in cytochrome c biogenesis permease subunit
MRRDQQPSRRRFPPIPFFVVFPSILVFGTFGATALLTKLVGDICWPPRLGGALVGFAVILQGYLIANPERFQRLLRSGISSGQRVNHIVYVATSFGTLLWTFGDLFRSIYGVALCRAVH